MLIKPKIIIFTILILSITILGGCFETTTDKTETVVKNSESKMVSFIFEKSKNVGLFSDIYGEIKSDSKVINVKIPSGINITTLKATFTLSQNAVAKVNGITQFSGESINDFTNQVIYTIFSEDEKSTTQYLITVKQEIIIQNNPPSIPKNPNPVSESTGASIDIELSWSASSDPDNDPVTYDLYIGDSKDNMILTASNLTTPKYTPKIDYGKTYYWKVTAKDSKGEAVTGAVWSFGTKAKEVEPVTSDGDTFDTAMPMEVNSKEISNNVGKTQEGKTDSYDWYKIVLNYPGKLELHTNNGVIFEFYNSKNSFVSYAALGSDKLSYSYTNYLTAGTYYIKCYSQNSNPLDYNLSALFTKGDYPDDEAARKNELPRNDNFETAAVLSIGAETKGYLSYMNDLSETDNYDWYKIVITEPGKLQLDTTNKVLFEFYNSNNSFISYASDNGDKSGYTYTNYLIAGTYYVKCYSQDNTPKNYKLSNSFVKGPFKDDEAPRKNDTPRNDVFETAASFGINSELNGYVSYLNDLSETDDYDWYKITLSEPGKLEINSNTKVLFEFYSFNNGFISYASDNSDKSGYSYTKYLTAGTYYIKTYSQDNKPKSYTISNKFTKGLYIDDEAPRKDGIPRNDTFEQAKLTNINSDLVGYLSYLNDLIETDSYDWYKVTVVKPGKLEINTTKAMFEMYGSNGSFMEYAKKTVDSDNKFNFTGYLTEGIYYIKLYSYNNESIEYSCSSKFTPGDYVNEEGSRSTDKNKNDTIESAMSINKGAIIYGYVSYRNDLLETDSYDWYKISASGALSIKTTNNTMFEVYNSSKTFASYSKDGKTSQTEREFTITDMSEYGNVVYIKLYPQDSTPKMYSITVY